MTQSNGMSIDILSKKANPYSIPELAEIGCFEEFKSKNDSGIDTNKVVVYTILLYSKDSFLNKKPMPQLKDRRLKAATLADLDPENQNVIDDLFQLLNESIRTLIVEYVIWQSNEYWTERCITEAQLDENRRIRMKPIQNKVTAPIPKKKKKKSEEEFEIDDEEIDPTQDDKYIIEASEKKHKLSNFADDYIAKIKKFDAIIFMDHDDVKKAATRKQRMSLESMVK